MTVKKRDVEEARERAEKDENSDGQIVVKYDRKDNTIRYAILFAALSATPFGQQILKNIGIAAPATEQVSNVEVKLDRVAKDLATLADESRSNVKSVAELKANLGELKAKADKLETSFVGFQVDFDKHRVRQNLQPAQ